MYIIQTFSTKWKKGQQHMDLGKSVTFSSVEILMGHTPVFASTAQGPGVHGGRNYDSGY